MFLHQTVNHYSNKFLTFLLGKRATISRYILLTSLNLDSEVSKTHTVRIIVKTVWGPGIEWKCCVSILKIALADHIILTIIK